MFFLQNPPPAQVASAQPIGLTPEIRSKATALEQAKDWDGLADFLETLDPRSRGFLLEAWLRALKNANRLERLLQVCEAAIPQLEPPNTPRLSTARIYRAQALSKLGRRAEAIAAYRQNGKLGDPTGLRNACAVAQAGSDWPTLAELAKELEPQAPFKKEALLWQGESFFNQVRLAEAEATFKACIQLDRAQPFAWAMLGACLAARKAYPEALEALDTAISGDPTKPEPFFNRALVRFGLKQYAEGREDVLKAKALEPEDPGFRTRLDDNLRWVDKFLKSQGQPVAPGPKPN